MGRLLIVVTSLGAEGLDEQNYRVGGGCLAHSRAWRLPEAIRLRPPLRARDRDARRIDHVSLNLTGARPMRRPKAVAAGFIDDGEPLDRAPGLNGFIPSTMQKLRQPILVARELLWRLAFDSGHDAGDQPTRLAHFDH
jgi:hypothetical protein